ncbi:NtaA/DmoA family FMN-dependent monooxygenase [Ketogulonicigenium vulgare]|uniref:Flavin-dependent oxidoreductase, F420-dependent methylene-tetrahydromethanopterin reductase n=2 Tax=Ketogulonicigenium vulgare TaxID=92945 RepID=F9Y810_KETVW|nr:NtaA/DmoA family FMN-dependent monooxygenase [Ketogulonicigenium vulgare]AEM41136.1 Flavin-dependent oxidoreductase, F420-dependent methylene-tetrahydromethanopterin reductase [Ketogulonicigenium vulgare WSH-001]ALJ81275.1 methylene-tetrahydromethanopterin reductase [Ketogulonicigenium vulgare]ANW34013.1 methylene-tetrahydromethanopterin reductase [Ketogulonicigenium vulgare]
MRKIHLGYDLSWTHLEGRWRMPGSWSHATFPDMRIYREIAQIAERGLLDFLFFGDGNGIPSTYQGKRDGAVKWGLGWPRLDMSPYIAAMSQLTQHIGFGLTYSSTFMHPFYTARLLNSLDHVTGGRLAFNVIASSRRADAANYGFDELMEHARRYERMEEFMDVCFKLWASVEPDAMIWDRTTGQVADPHKVHAINHKGEFFSVAGPLASPPSPQGRPVIVQAGVSPRGVEAAAKFTDMIFASSPGLEKQVAHRKRIDDALVLQGRDPAGIGIIWDVVLIVGETEAEAKHRHKLLANALPPEALPVYLSHHSGFDMSKLPAQFTVNEINAEIVKSNASPVGFLNMAQMFDPDQQISRAEFFDAMADHATGADHAVVGDATQIADYLEETFVATGERGGFMIAHPTGVPRDLLNVIDFLVPELQRRGRYRTAYRGKTLRENLSDDE